MMLYQLIDDHRDQLVMRARARVSGRPSPLPSSGELEYGVPLFLQQLSDTLRLEATATPFASDAIGSTATRHGSELLAAGFTVAQVVHDYGDICQTITELALEQWVPISVEEFHTMNRCLDTAIAEAVTEHSRLGAQARSNEEIGRLGQMAHELRDLLNAALMAFHALNRGSAPINGSTAAVLGRSLSSMLGHIDHALSEVRLSQTVQRRELTSVATLIDEIAATGALHAEYRAVRFTVAPVDPTLSIEADRQLLGAAVMNLLHNAFKNTRAGGIVTLSAHLIGSRVLIGVEDECGGIPENKADLFQAFGERRGTDRSGLGLGLSIARQAVRAHGGDIQVRNMPGHGCVFTIDIPSSHASADLVS